MSAVAAYFGNIKEAIVTTLVGLGITSRHLWTQPPSTVLYPEVPVEKLLPERYRGFLVNEVEICTGCKLCAVVCPIDVIYIEVEKDEESGTRILTRYDIDLGRCMYCGLCLEPCPTGSIHFTPQFEGATSNLGDLYRAFVDKPMPIYKNPKVPKPPKDESPAPAAPQEGEA
jgi:formate hydrogenlyase subunit 6/NADH:ubiquinone oxidoreductase subunit I